MTDGMTWRWPLPDNGSVVLTFSRPPVYEQLLALRRVLDVVIEGYAPPRVVPVEIAGIRVIRFSNPHWGEVAA